VPAIKPAAEQSRSGVIGLLGTKATIRQTYVDRLEAEFAVGKTLVRHAAPALVGAAEAKLRGETPDPQIFTDAIAGLARQPGGERIDRIILGCTHFPLVETELGIAAAEASLQAALRFVDGSDGIARRVAHLTAGQAWPKERAPGLFVTTGDVGQLEAYRAQLAHYGIAQTASL
jgi:glutamate racemase